MSKKTNGSRNLIGYGRTPPNPNWPNNSRLALQFVLNYEEGGERCILDGDARAEQFLSEMYNAPDLPGQRHMSMESLFEYGSRAGVWRVLNLFEAYDLPLTVFAVAAALEKNADVTNAIEEAGHEICSHGYKWIDYQHVDERVEREHISMAIKIIERETGQRPLGWYTGRTSPNTNRLVSEEGGFLYCSDDYSDDLPFWDYRYGEPQLVIPYTMDNNDMRFCSPQGFATGQQFFDYLKDSFDTLYEEGHNAPKMMSVGLHCRIIGRPGRIKALKRFLDYVSKKEDIWICKRIEIAQHWHKNFPPAEQS